MSLKYYTGVGSRTLDNEQSEFITLLARAMRERGIILRSGDASGADTAFQDGAGVLYETWIPWSAFAKGPGRLVPTSDQYDIARTYLIESGILKHFDKMGRASKLFHARNYRQVYGEEGAPIAEVCFYCAPLDREGNPKGGTRTAVLLCKERNIPTYNLFTKEDRKIVKELFL